MAIQNIVRAAVPFLQAAFRSGSIDDLLRAGVRATPQPTGFALRPVVRPLPTGFAPQAARTATDLVPLRRPLPVQLVNPARSQVLGRPTPMGALETRPSRVFTPEPFRLREPIPMGSTVRPREIAPPPTRQILAGNRKPIGAIETRPSRTIAMETPTVKQPIPMGSAPAARQIAGGPARRELMAGENPETIAIRRALDEAEAAAGRQATAGRGIRTETLNFADEVPPGGPPGGPPGVGAVDEAVEAVKKSGKSKKGILKAAAKLAAGTAIGFAPDAINQFEEKANVDVPDSLESAILIALGLGTGYAGIRGALRRNSSKFARGLSAVNIPVGAYTAYQGLTVSPTADTGAGSETTTTEGVQIPKGGVVGPQAEGVPETAEDDAQTQIDAIDAAFQSAVDQIMQSYGGVEEALRALDSGDPYLAQALASLDSQYRQAQAAVAAEYSAAIGDIAGYQEQVDALMQEVASQQAADFEAAAGGLENMAVGVDPATAALAAEAGISDTAVGGGAVTGAGLARGLAGAASAAGAAERIRTGSELAGLVAATRQEAAAQQAGLSQNYLSQRYQAEVESAMAEAERRQAIEDALIQNKLEMGQALSQIELQRAQQLGALSPQDFAAASGTTRQLPTPKWFGGKLEGAFDAPVPELPQVYFEDEAGRLAPRDVQVGEVNALLDQLYGASSGARELYNQGRKSEAYTYLTEFYGKVPTPEWFTYLGVPATAYETYTQLFGEQPF